MDPAEFRRTGHAMIDRLADYLETVADRPLFPAITPARLAALFDEPLPRDGMPAERVIAELDEKLFPYCTHVGHPGYLGLITPSPNPMGIIGDLIASTLNQNPGAWTIGPSAVAMEQQTVRWLTDLVGWDDLAGGNLTSGGMMANFVGLKLARDALSADRAQLDGVEGRWAAYTSEERHVAVDKSVDAIGLGRNALRVLPTDDRYRLNIDALEDAIAADRRSGIRPMCIIAMAGTTNNGAVDDLHTLHSIAKREGMWLHADAAYGGGMLISRNYPGVLDGIDLVDSITIDPHKWFFAPLDAGAILVRDAARLTASFGLAPPYLTDRKDEAGERYNYYMHSFEQSRRFRALKVWMTFKRYGAEEIARWIDRNVAQARHLYEQVTAGDEFVAACPPVMSAVCIRWLGDGMDESVAGPLHVDVARRIEESGRFWIATTSLKGRTFFRINPVNFRTRLSDMDELLELLREECRGR